MGVDIHAPGGTRLMADMIATSVDEAGAQPGKYSWRVKPSSLAGDCIAKQWYAWRWVNKRVIPARIARIFARGHRNEHHLSEVMRKAGWRIQDTDPAKAGRDFNQWNVKALNGHLSAYADGKGSHPVFTLNVDWLVEYKTFKKSEFTRLQNKKAVKATHYEYYGQACIYMMLLDLPACIFVGECKDDDELYFEVILRDDGTAQHLLGIGQTIATSRVRPARVAESPAFHKCKHCDYAEPCHFNKPVDRNCRSCTNCVIADGGKFLCERWGKIIPAEAEILAACNFHNPVV